MAETAEKLMTVAEFLTWNDGTDTRYELVRGKIVAMAPSSAKPLRDSVENRRRVGSETKAALLCRNECRCSAARPGRHLLRGRPGRELHST